MDEQELNKIMEQAEAPIIEYCDETGVLQLQLSIGKLLAEVSRLRKECESWNGIYNARCERHEAALEQARTLMLVEQKARSAEDWFRANIEEMECRGDEDCDHCVAVQVKQELESALAAGKEKS